MYSDKVMDHFANPRNVGELENANAVGQVGNAKCGDIMKIYMDIEDVDDSIHAYLEDYPDIDCCDVRDMIIYNSDFEHYSLEELLETLIKENIDE